MVGQEKLIFGTLYFLQSFSLLVGIVADITQGCFCLGDLTKVLGQKSSLQHCLVIFFSVALVLGSFSRSVQKSFLQVQISPPHFTSGVFFTWIYHHLCDVQVAKLLVFQQCLSSRCSIWFLGTNLVFSYLHFSFGRGFLFCSLLFCFNWPGDASFSLITAIPSNTALQGCIIC